MPLSRKVRDADIGLTLFRKCGQSNACSSVVASDAAAIRTRRHLPGGEDRL
jgi:hypothetical protein